MASLSIPTSRTASRPSRPSRFPAILTATVEFLQLIAAATRAARAVEARRSPHPDDLRTLGVSGKLPETW